MRSKIIIQTISLLILSTFNIAQEVEPEVTIDRKKLVILTSEDENNEVSDKISQIAGSAAADLKRFIVIDRNQLKRLLKEQKLQHSGVVDQDQAVELGKVAAANEALLIRVQNFGQRGIPKIEEDEEPLRAGVCPKRCLIPVLPLRDYRCAWVVEQLLFSSYF